MKKAALIYLATDKYISFWKNYYDTFEKNFLPGWEKHYYVITDQTNVYQENNSRVHLLWQDHYPWPIVTLLKFNIALRVEEELKRFDFVIQTNANLECESIVTEDEILPHEKVGERISCVIHPGYYASRKWDMVFDRNPKSGAYVPYNKGRTYVIGAVVGGKGEDYVEWMHEITDRTIEDLKKNIIPKWHDESYINHYVSTHRDVRLLHPGFCYPVGFDVPYERKIIGVPKNTVFDVDAFKGYYSRKRTFIQRIVLYLCGNGKDFLVPKACCIRDYILCRKCAK